MSHNSALLHFRFVPPPPLFFLLLRPPPTSTLFPYTTLFRSGQRHRRSQSFSLPCSLRRYSLYDRSSRSEEHTSELQSLTNLVCRLLLEKKNISASAVVAASGFSISTSLPAFSAASPSS